MIFEDDDGLDFPPHKTTVLDLHAGCRNQIAKLTADRDALLQALKAILYDHDDRGRIYPQSESQPNRVAVMEQGRKAIKKAEQK